VSGDIRRCKARETLKTIVFSSRQYDSKQMTGKWRIYENKKGEHEMADQGVLPL
jgi:hypothetical protein